MDILVESRLMIKVKDTIYNKIKAFTILWMDEHQTTNIINDMKHTLYYTHHSVRRMHYIARYKLPTTIPYTQDYTLHIILPYTMY